MSSAEPPRFPPPTGRPAWRFQDRAGWTRRVGYVLSVLVILAQVGILVVPYVIIKLWPDPSAQIGPATPSGGSAGPAAAGAGMGDPYFPVYGSAGYDALRYQVSVDWEPRTATLAGQTTITARAGQQLSQFYVDLALPASKITVDGADARFSKLDFQDLKITPASPIAAGAEFSVMIDYSGHPASVSSAGIAPFSITGSEALVAGEPESSAWWYPANDYPSDPAVFDVSARVPAGWQAVSIGELASKDTAQEADHDTWRWVSSRPVATYLTFLAIGHFELREGTADGLPFVYAVSTELSADQRRKAFAQLERTPAVIKVLESMFGPYPFEAIGGIVPAGRLWFDGLETQTRPVYQARAITAGDASELLSHELTHMWFGDNVTLRQWNDIFDNEAWASFGAWAYAERTGGRSANDAFERLYQRAAGKPEFWRVTMIDPGPDHLFDTVYARGPMTLQALRNVLGDDAFFAMARSWAQRPGSRSLEEWMISTQASSRVDLASFFDAWVLNSEVPARTVGNGFR